MDHDSPHQVAGPKSGQLKFLRLLGQSLTTFVLFQPLIHARAKDDPMLRRWIASAVSRILALPRKERSAWIVKQTLEQWRQMWCGLRRESLPSTHFWRFPASARVTRYQFSMARESWKAVSAACGRGAQPKTANSSSQSATASAWSTGGWSWASMWLQPQSSRCATAGPTLWFQLPG
jgi:hypothetical protein